MRQLKGIVVATYIACALGFMFPPVMMASMSVPYRLPELGCCVKDGNAGWYDAACFIYNEAIGHRECNAGPWPH